MPLIKSKSKKAFEKNVATEMKAHPGNRARDLAIAYSVQRKAKSKKKMAEGGLVSAKTEQRPMPDQLTDALRANTEAIKASRNSSGLKIHPFEQNELSLAAKKDKDFQTESRPMPKKGMKTTPIKHPKMVPSDSFSTRLRDEEDELQRSAATNQGPQRQPPKADDEEGANRQGPKVPDMQETHSTSRKPYAKGGKIEASDEAMHPKNKYEDDLTDLPPSEDEGAEMARHQNEEYQRQTSGNPDNSMPHSDDIDTAMYAEGGEVDEDVIEHAASVAAAIMAKRRMAREDGTTGSEDMNGAVPMAEGGDINGHGSMDTTDDDQADLSRNAEEDANEEDQASFNAMRKENYSESHMLKLDSPEDSAQIGDEREANEENIHDASIADKIRAKMKKRSPITR
jgi:hypothetical protein